MSMKHSATDRCDRDGAQAYTTWVNGEGHTLSFCGHHTAKFAEGLEGAGFTVSVDDMGILEAMHGQKRDAASAV